MSTVVLFLLSDFSEGFNLGPYVGTMFEQILHFIDMAGLTVLDLFKLPVGDGENVVTQIIHEADISAMNVADVFTIFVNLNHYFFVRHMSYSLLDLRLISLDTNIF